MTISCPQCGKIRANTYAGRYICSNCETKFIVDEHYMISIVAKGKVEYIILTTLRRYFIIAIPFAIAMLKYASDYILTNSNKTIRTVIASFLFLGFLGLIFFIGKFLGRGKFKVLIDDYGLKFSWINQSFLYSRLNRQIKCSNIKSYELKRGNQISDNFVIRTYMDKSFSFQHLDFDKKDDYRRFLLELEERVIQYNKVNEHNKIERTNYQTRYFIMMFIAFIIFLTILFIYKAIFNN